jgi:segregation and condensation protein A
VIDGFVSVLSAQREQIDFNQLSEFLLVAAILIELKSQKLLPGRETADDDEDLVGWEERDLLLARLLECRAYAAAADVFVALAEQASRSIGGAVHADGDDVWLKVYLYSRAQSVMGGTSQIQRNLVAGRILELPTS